MSGLILKEKSQQQIFLETIRYSYDLTDDCAGFITDFTNLFQEIDGTSFEPYGKQVEFINLLNKKDRIVVILKPRQCLTGDSLIDIGSKKIKIKELYEMNYRDNCISFNGFCKSEDKIVDIWEAGVKEVYEVTLSNGLKLKSTLEHKYNTNNGFKELKYILNTDLIVTQDGLAKLKDLKYLGFEMTYDLETEKFHNYFANGINVHNSGFSTAIVARAVFEAYFNKIPEIIVVSATRTQAEKVLDRIRKAFYSMPDFMIPKFKQENKSMLELQNGIKIISLSSNPDSMRGWTGTFYLDEYAIIPENDSIQIYEAVYPSTTKTGRIVAISTPKGKKGMYYRLATQSFTEITGKQIKNDKKIFRIEWKDVPHIVDAVENKGLFDGLDAQMLDQEYNLNFRDEENEPYLSDDFLMENFIDREGDIPLFTCFEDIKLNDYIDDHEKMLPSDLNYKILKEAYEAENGKIPLEEVFEDFIGAWDIASVNDDSIFGVAGIRRDNPLKKEIIFEMDLKKLTQDIIRQANYAKKLIDFFQLSQLVLDYRGLGRGVGDYILNDEKYDEDMIIKFEATQDNKVDGFVNLKSEMSKGFLKRRFDGSKQDKYQINQCQNMYMIGNRIIGKGGKDDYPNMLMMLIQASSYTEGGFYVI